MSKPLPTPIPHPLSITPTPQLFPSQSDILTKGGIYNAFYF